MLQILFLATAGILAGVIGTAGGITSLVAYPALLAVGIPPLAANVTNSVALLGSGISSAAQAGPDLHGHGPTVRRWLPTYAGVSLAGAVVLVLTPRGVFDRVVPYLVAIGALVLLLQPIISRWQLNRGRSLSRPAVGLAGVGVAFYNGYFGAGAGILLIVLLLFTSEPVLHRANSMKNVILFGSDVLPAVLFGLVGSVVWPAVWPLGLGAVIGGLLGPAVARRIPANLLRALIALGGFALAGYLYAAA